MRRSDDQRWQELADLEALGVPLEGEDAAFFAAYAAAHPECAAEQAAWDGLLGELRGSAEGLEGAATGDDGDDQAFVTGLLETYRASPTSTSGAQAPSPAPSAEVMSAEGATSEAASTPPLAAVHSLPARSRWPLLAVGALAAAAALAVVLLQGDSASSDTPAPRQARATTPSPPQVPETQEPPDNDPHLPPQDAPESALIALASPGGLRIDGEDATAGDRITEGATLSAELESCMVFDSPFASVCLSPGTTASLRRTHGGDRIFDLERGALVATLDTIPEGRSFKVIADGYQARAVGTVFSVRIAEDAAELGVFEGIVELRGPQPGRPARSLQAREHTVFDAEAEIGALPEDLEAWSRARTSLADLWRGLESGAPSQLHLGTSSAALSIDDTPLADLPHERPQGIDMLLASGDHELRIAGRSGARSRVLNASPDAAITLSSDLLKAPESRTKTRSEPSQAPSGPSLAELRRLASDARATRSWLDAKAAYEDLIERYPEAPEAHNARVQLGDLLRRRLGQPSEALVHFGAYLDRDGPLAAEARFGKVLALQQLGRRADEARAIEEFLAHHPEHIEAEKLRARARELAAP